MELKSLKNQDLYRRVQQSLKEFIVATGMKAGDTIPTELELSKKLGVSRTAIREGLKALEALGIVEVRAGVGRFLCSFNFEVILDNLSYSLDLNVKDFRDVLDVRIMLESGFLVRDLDKFSADRVNKLRDILANMAELVNERADEKELIAEHTAFHMELYQHSGNAFLLNLIRICATIQRNLTLVNRYRTSDKASFVEQHRRLIDAIEQRDPVLVRSRLMEHFEEAIMWSQSEVPIPYPKSVTEGGDASQ